MTTSSIVGSVVDMLARDNPSAANRFAREFHCQDTNPSQQVRALNVFWRDQLSSLHTSTISARTCLVDDISPEDWLRHFGQLVLPTIVKHDLPATH